MKAPLTLKLKAFYFQPNYRQLAHASALNQSNILFLFITQPDLLGSEKQTYVLVQNFTGIDGNQGARVSLWDVLGSKECLNSNVSHNRDHEERLQ